MELILLEKMENLKQAISSEFFGDKKIEAFHQYIYGVIARILVGLPDGEISEKAQFFVQTLIDEIFDLAVVIAALEELVNKKCGNSS